MIARRFAVFLASAALGFGVALYELPHQGPAPAAAHGIHAVR